MTHHILEMPVDEARVRRLRIGDTVTLERTLFGIRDATLIAMFDKDRRTTLDMNGHAVVHTAPNVRKVDVSNENPAGYESVCIGTTTSMRMERFTRPLMEREGVRIIIGKGGDKLKAIGTQARKDMERLFGGKVFLELWVRVRSGWADDEAALKRLGME